MYPAVVISPLSLEALEMLAKWEHPASKITTKTGHIYPHHVAANAATALRTAIEQAEQGQWDAIPDAFNEWWNADYDDSTNPFRLNSPAYWAWAGWSAANKEKNT